MTEDPNTCGPPPEFPASPVDLVINPLKRFLHIQTATGIVLLLASVSALVIVNAPFGERFLSLWEIEIRLSVGTFHLSHSLHHWVNDGLMTVFFFVIGLEVKREIVLGELRDPRQAALPVFAALGGMMVPAAIYLSFPTGEVGIPGWGIPMATDIAFVVGGLALLGDRVPSGLRVMLLSLAIVDDIGAIIVIAAGYTDHINMTALLLAGLGIAATAGLIRLGVRNALFCFAMMFLVWLALHASGIHATITGVVFGLITPTRSWIGQKTLAPIVERTLCFLRGEGWNLPRSERYVLLRQMEIAAQKSISPLERYEAELHPWVGFVIMPLFALANAGFVVEIGHISHPVALAVMAGLFFGKPIGIVTFSWFAVKLGFARLPRHVSWKAMLGSGFLGGIGFTMALFIDGLAFDGDLLDAGKIGILIGSVLSAVVGMSILKTVLPQPAPPQSKCPVRAIDRR